MPNNRDVAELNCLGCKRPLQMPRGAFDAMKRRNGYAVAFCSNRCQKNYIASEADRQKARNIDQ